MWYMKVCSYNIYQYKQKNYSIVMIKQLSCCVIVSCN
nr:MAG TPA: hypothetical protein [Caudoviricetes sp.]DAJ33484.1 MAG TPA: hypothetical protein [Caudoviricetes sp.]